MPDPSRSPATSITSEPERMAHAGWTDDRLISIQEIRTLFGLGRTAGYELTHRHGFPEPVVISPRCYRWWASEVTAFAASMRRQGPAPGHSGGDSRVTTRRAPRVSASSGHISGTVRLAHTRRRAQ